MYTAKSSPWWLKRWIVNSIDKFDRMLFSNKAEQPYASFGLQAYQNLLTIVCAAALVGLSTLFFKAETQQSVGEWILGIGGVLLIIQTGLYLFYSLKAFPSLGVKILRVLFAVMVTYACLFLGIMMANLLVFALIAVVLLYFFGFIGGSDKKQSDNCFQLDNGTIVRKEVGMLGEVTYAGNDGYTYQRDGDRFTRV